MLKRLRRNLRAHTLRLLIQHRHQILGLLQRHLGQRRQRRPLHIRRIPQRIRTLNRAAIPAQDAQVTIGQDPRHPLLRLLDVELLHQRMHPVARGPDQHPERQPPVFRGEDGVRLDPLDVRARRNPQARLAPERVHGVLAEARIEGAEQGIRHIVDGDGELAIEVGVQVTQVVVPEVVELGGGLDADGAAADDAQVQQVAPVLRRHRRQRRHVQHFEQALLDRLRVARRFEEVGVLLGARRAEGLDVAPRRDGDFIVPDFEVVVLLAGERGEGFAGDDAVLKIDVLGRGFVVFDG